MMVSQSGTARGAEKSGLVVGDDPYGYRFHQRLHASLGNERLHEQRTGKLGKDLWGNASAKVNAAGGHDFQSKIAGLGAEDRDKKVHCMFTQGTLAFNRSVGDGRGRIAMDHLFGEPARFGAASGVAQKMKDVNQAGP